MAKTKEEKYLLTVGDDFNMCDGDKEKVQKAYDVELEKWRRKGTILGGPILWKMIKSPS